MRDEIEDAAAPTSVTAPAWDAARKPAVASIRRPRDMWLISGGAILAGLLVLLWLESRRTAEAAETHPAHASAYQAAPATPAEVVNFASTRPASDAPPTMTAAAVAPAPVAVSPSGPDLRPAPLVTSETDPTARLRAPALIVDLGDQDPSAEALPPAASSGGAGQPPASTVAAGTPGGNGGLNGDEQFARRVSGGEPDRAEATRIRNLRDTIPQGAMIPGVLETALDSDLPGFTRAVVSRDVRGFDGSTVLIPQGSRVIGEYKSAAAQGQTRAFIIWTRIIRPDGVSIQIGSSGTDPLGRAGLAGSVNNHFIDNYGGAILLSVIQAGITSLATVPSTQVVIGSTTNSGVGGIGALTAPTIPPTIKVPQGAPIRIFVARDLDFSSAGGTGR
jgi:type IV secretory pathway VirB10-like protein